MSQSMFPVPQESDSLSSLEERIQRAIQLVARLRQEKEAAVAEAAEARADAQRMADELKSLQAERKQVRGRIERLLEQIDELNAG
jgi:chromosome segregation ATPase